MQVSVTITESQIARLRVLDNAAVGIVPPLVTAFGAASQIILGRAVRNRFTGKGPFPVAEHRLGVRTNRLRKSLTATQVQVDPSVGTISVSMGSNVIYFRQHEFGFKGRVQVRSFVRRFIGKDTKTYRGKLTKQTKKRIRGRIESGRSNYSHVRAHSRKLDGPARRPLGTEIESDESRKLVSTRVQSAITNFLRTE